MKVINMKKIFLDDVREPSDCVGYARMLRLPVELYSEHWVIVRNYKQFVTHIELMGVPDIVSFDHDLADEHYDPAMTNKSQYDSFKEKTGYCAAKWLVEYCRKNNFPLPVCFCHSMNPVGRENINQLFKQKK